METKIDYSKKEINIILREGETIIIKTKESDNADYIKIKREDAKLYITTNYTENMKMYPLVEASQRLLGISPKRCKCGDERGGLSHLHPIFIPFEFED